MTGMRHIGIRQDGMTAYFSSPHIEVIKLQDSSDRRVLVRVVQGHSVVEFEVSQPDRFVADVVGAAGWTREQAA